MTSSNGLSARLIQMKAPHGIFVAPLILCAWVSGSAPSFAADFCSDLDTMAQQVRQGTPADPIRMAGASACQTALQPEGPAFFCFWSFALRDERAPAFQAQLARNIETCGGVPVTGNSEIPVNHPDSYSTSRFDLKDLRASIALKDKAGLRKTLVFLRLAPPARTE
jgi:hypothetical protein